MGVKKGCPDWPCSVPIPPVILQTDLYPDTQEQDMHLWGLLGKPWEQPSTGGRDRKKFTVEIELRPSQISYLILGLSQGGGHYKWKSLEVLTAGNKEEVWSSRLRGGRKGGTSIHMGRAGWVDIS